MRYPNNRGSDYQLFNFVLSFGITMAIVLYLTYRGGIWLDQKLNTEPICMIFMVILGIVATTRIMIRDLNKLSSYDEKNDKEDLL